MAKTYVNTVKYVIHVDFEIKGVVDKPDIIGAIFGQSEGLLGEEMDLRELQKNGRVGRIEIKYKSERGKTRGVVLVPSSMDMVETSILAATMETVEKVGPCEASFKVRNIEDTRTLKRKDIADRAQTLLKNFISSQMPDVQELAEKVREEVRVADVQAYGPEKIACGPGIFEDDSIIVVEGRADVLNLLRNGVKNVIAMGGSKIPPSIAKLTKRKTVTLFVDGDRGGALNVRKMAQIGDIDYVARAPEGKEVEELARKEIIMALRRKVPAAQAKTELSGRPSFKQTVKPAAVTAAPVAAAPTIATPAPATVKVEQEELGELISKPAFSRDRLSGRDRGRRPGRSSDRGSGRGRPSTRSSSRPSGRSTGSPAAKGIRGGSRDRKPFGGPARDYQPGDEPKEVMPVEPAASAEEKKTFEPIMKALKGSLKAKLLGAKNKELAEVPVRELLKSLDKKKKIQTIVFDGIVTNRVIEEAQKAGVGTVVGIKKGRVTDDKGVNIIVLG